MQRTALDRDLPPRRETDFDRRGGVIATYELWSKLRYGGGGAADKHTHKVARSCCVGAVSSPLCPSCKPCFLACRVDDAQRNHVGCTAARRRRRRTDRTSVTKPVSNAQARIVTLKRQDPFICREKSSVPSLAHVWVSFLRGNHRTSSPSLCPTADGVTFIRDIVYQDRNISTQAISLPNVQAAQTTLYFRKLPLGSTGRTTMENLIYLRPSDVFFSLFFVAPALWRVECECRGGRPRSAGPWTGRFLGGFLTRGHVTAHPLP